MINRQSQSPIYKNVKKIGWIFTIISLIIIAVGVGLLINYCLKLKDNQPKEDINNIAKLITYINNLYIDGSGRDHVVHLKKQLVIASNALNDLDNNYISHIETAMNISCAGIICFFCIRMVVNVILIFRAYDDKMSIIESNSLFNSRVFHHIAIIICQIVALILFSIVYPQYVSSVIQEFCKFLDSMQLWTQSSINKTSQVSLDAAQTSEQQKVLSDVVNQYNRIYAYYFNPNTKLGDFKQLYNLIISRDTIPSFNEIKKTVEPTLWSNVFNYSIIMASFIGAWLLFNASNSIVTIIIITKFNQENDPLQPKKIMFDKGSRATYI